MNLREFVNPPKHARPCPVWSWNYLMEAAEIENRVRDMKKKGFGGFLIQARPGLRTPFLEDEWMRAVRRAVETARDTEMECWLTDDESQPGGAGKGAVVRDDPSARAMALVWEPDARKLVESGEIDSALLFVRPAGEGTAAPETSREKPDDPAGWGAFFTIRPGDAGAYPDLMQPETVRAFLDAVHEKYSKLFRYDFGEYMPGMFTMDPRVAFDGSPDGSGRVYHPWTAGFEAFFEDMIGYSPIDYLYLLLDSADEDGRFGFLYDYRRAVTERFLRSFTIESANWCREHDLFLSGRIPGGSGLAETVRSGGASMAHAEYTDIPAAKVTGAGPTGLTGVRRAASAAGQLGRKRVLCQLFEGAGHDITFSDMKHTADACLAAGATFLSPHMVQFSLKGARKRECPPALSYHQPSWEHIRVINDYLGRVSWAVSRGRPAARVLVMEPSGPAYGAVHPCRSSEYSSSDGERYEALLEELASGHIAFDLGDERLVGRHGSAEGGVFRVGRMAYDAVVLPASRAWRGTTLDLLDAFDGAVLLIGEPARYVDGRPSDRMSAFAARVNVTTAADEPEAARILAESCGRDVTVTGPDGETARAVRVNHRVEAGAHLLFLANTDRENDADITVTVRALGGVVELDALTGRAWRYASRVADGTTVIGTKLHPGGSRIFVIDQTQTSVEPGESAFEREELVIDGPYSFQRLHDNVVVIDRCRLEMDGKTVLKDASLPAARDAVWHATGIDEYRDTQPWVMEQRNVRTRTNQTRLTFTFTVENIPEHFDFVMESGDKFTVHINGVKAEPTPGKWHLDKRFTVFAAAEHAVEGLNTVTAETDFLWDTEIENVYLYGDFAVGTESEGFPVRYEQEVIGVGDWCGEGYAFYPGAMSYKMEFPLEFDGTERFELDLSGAKGTTLFVTVNGTDIGAAPFHPYRAEITGALKQGDNTVEIEVVGSLRNTLGPLRIPPESAPAVITPESFLDDVNSDGAMHFEPYGFLEPPKLVRIRGAAEAEDGTVVENPPEEETVDETVERAGADESGEEKPEGDAPPGEEDKEEDSA